MIAVAIVVLVAVSVVAQIQFSDVPEDHPRWSDINFVAERGAFRGYPDGTFQPDLNITPDQMTNVLVRAFPGGMTRGEFASMLRNGYEQTATTTTAVPTPTTARVADYAARAKTYAARAAVAAADYVVREHKGSNNPAAAYHTNKAA